MPLVLKRLKSEKKTPIRPECSHFFSGGIHKLQQLLNSCNSRLRLQTELSCGDNKSYVGQA